VETAVDKNFRASSEATRPQPQKLTDLSPLDLRRFPSGIGEFDRCIGGGLVGGEVVLLSGEPGIGKSTLLLQVLKGFDSLSGPLLYVCGEESPLQVKSRSQRLNLQVDRLVLYPETRVEFLVEYLLAHPPALVVVDSIQAVTTESLGGSAGSIGQVREAAYILTQLAKNKNFPLIMVGHVTKEGGIAGPKVLEHLVDAVLNLEGSQPGSFRILRATKNRFGSVREVGVFEMTTQGLIGVANPSDRFLEERLIGVSGSVVTVLVEGLRPVLVEVQALTTPTAFGLPRRTASGFPINRLLLLIAVLEKRLGLKLQSQDIYVNIAAGLRADEPAVDLAVCLAINSSLKDLPLDSKVAVFGEVGLSGEVRQVSLIDERSAEAKRLGYQNIISPKVANTLKEAANMAFIEVRRAS